MGKRKRSDDGEDPAVQQVEPEQAGEWGALNQGEPGMPIFFRIHTNVELLLIKVNLGVGCYKIFPIVAMGYYCSTII